MYNLTISKIDSLYYISRLTYNYSQYYDESINIGVILILPHVKKVKFSYSEGKIDVLRYLYPKINTSELIKIYCECFQKVTDTINGKFKNSELDFSEFVMRDTQDFIHREYLVRDATSLQFSDYKKKVLYNKSPDVLITNEFESLGLNHF